LGQFEVDNAFTISWESEEKRIWLDEVNSIIPLLLKSQLLKYNDKILSYGGETEIFLTIERDLPFYNTCIEAVIDDENIAFGNSISDEFFLQNNIVYRHFSIGNSYKSLKLFTSKIEKSDLNMFLSLFTSHFENIRIHENDVKVMPGYPIVPEPTILIDKIDDQNQLYIKQLLSLKHLPLEFLDEFDVSTAVKYEEEDRKIKINQIDYNSTLDFDSGFEKLIKRALKKGGADDKYYKDENLYVLNEIFAKRFLTDNLSDLLVNYKVVGADNLSEFKIRTVQPKLSVNLKSGIDFLEGEADVEILDQKISVMDFIADYKDKKYVELSNGEKVIINKDYVSRLERVFRKNKKTDLKLSIFDLTLIDDLIEEKISQPWYNQTREIFEGFNEIAKQKNPKVKIKGELRNYQLHGYKWLKYLNSVSLGGCLADDMGLGKTVQTISLLSDFYPRKKKQSLIIMPRTLLFNWADEFEKFNPKIKYHIYHGTQRFIEPSANVILTTYEMVRNDIEKFKDEKFFYIILDESQKIKNVNTKISKAVMLLNGKHRLALSGTPLENNLRELYSLFRFLNPSMFGTIKEFDQQYTMPIQKENDEIAATELRKKTYPFILRRLKGEVVQDLPPKVEQLVHVEMNKDQKKLYEERRVYYREMIKGQIEANGVRKSQFIVLQALNELRQIATMPELKNESIKRSAKRDAIIEQITDIIENGHKVLLFSNFIGTLELISEDLTKAKIDYVMMTGATRNREKLVSDFQHNEKLSVFLMTLKTGGVGLNLTAADYVFILDPWWNAAAESQAIDRTHRIGQDKTVFSYKMITKDTIEDKIILLQEKKSQLFDKVIGSDSASVKFLTEDDIDYLLG
jgi:SNF2 family DNA or RNA helicase